MLGGMLMLWTEMLIMTEGLMQGTVLDDIVLTRTRTVYHMVSTLNDTKYNELYFGWALVA